MKRIDRETVQRILDAADIVEVVSDFVKLKRRGANYIGLCPFHNERTPSFSVSKSKGICKCFSCGKGGAPVNFLMELEQMSYQEALRWLANKYHIEIKEREESEEERRQASEREQMFAVNEFAMNHFKQNLTDTDDGRAIGLTYFRQRGISDAMIERFRLGYAIDRSDDLRNAANHAGYKDEYLEKTGLTIRNEQGRVYDRFRGRVIYPVHTLSGKVVAFGGRTLRTDKNASKYVNSPESQIYRKSFELYGMYQARQAIARTDKCILVEGYMDVISMSQAGIENVVASSGTSLTDGQIRMIHRFTQNVTVIYDSDAAGIKASLRGIDLLLAEGLNIKVLLLPDGDDPDSFAQHNPAEVVEQYIKDNETDFIRFKTRILLEDAGSDPMKRSKVISDILRSISVIPDAVTRGVYADECARLMGVKADMLHIQLKKLVADIAYRQALKQQGDKARSSVDDLTPQQIQDASDDVADINAAVSRRLRPYEEALLKLVLKHGNYAFTSYANPENPQEMLPLRVIDYVAADLENDEVTFTDAALAHVFQCAVDMAANEWSEAHNRFVDNQRQIMADRLEQGRRALAAGSMSVADITRGEIELNERVQREFDEAVADFDAGFVARRAVSSPDDMLRRISTDLIVEPHQLSKIYSNVPSERERLLELLPRTLHELKSMHLSVELDTILGELKLAQERNDTEEVTRLITRMMERKALQNDFARYLGERNLNPDRLPGWE